MDLQEEFLALIDALNRNGVEYGVCGGIALAIHGYPRFTKDIDILVRPEDLDRVFAVAAERGFVIAANPLRFDAGTAKEREVRRISKIAGEDVMTLDLLLSTGILQAAWDDREAFEWEGRVVKAVSAPALVRMKRIAGRDQDLLDVRRLEGGDDESDR
ncbi:MAG TPA: nucleotidyltransferase family protein [Thermoanaerobaculia bacterium]|nr:nucleotidyltransferase family protein [Thermoanaerobaculia bacterium]